MKRKRIGITKEKLAERVMVELLQCKHGHKAMGSAGSLVIMALSIGNTRITSLKCCGSWEVVWTFYIDGPDVCETLKELSCT